MNKYALRVFLQHISRLIIESNIVYVDNHSILPINTGSFFLNTILFILRDFKVEIQMHSNAFLFGLFQSFQHNNTGCLKIELNIVYIDSYSILPKVKYHFVQLAIIKIV